MERKIREILEKIRALELELEDALAERSRILTENFRKQKITFDSKVKALHRTFKRSLLRQIFTANPLYILIAPVIYAMIIPIAFLDLTIWLYMHITFPVYRIPIVPRKNYFIVDRHKLSYLNSLEKINCVYCGYGNALAAYAREIIARTELFWCPIKHSSKLSAPHSRYDKFFDYGDAEGYQRDLKKIRNDYEDSGAGD